MTRLSITIDASSTIPVVTVAGEIDLANVDRLRGDLGDVATGAAGAGLIVDLAGVSYLDSAGIQELVAVAVGLRAHRTPMALVVPDDSPLHRVFKITRFDEVAVVCSSRDDASAAIARQLPPA